MMKKCRVILLTACVNPKGMVFTKLQNPSERLIQYQEALRWYLENTNYPIVFCENTNTDISVQYKQYINNRRLEYICFDGNNYDKKRGKGYGEALIIEYALLHSNFLKKANFIIKITGRLILKNINQLISAASNSNKVYANLHKWNMRLICDSRLFIAPPVFLLKFFLPQIEKLNDANQYYFEHLLYDQIQKYIEEGGKHSEFYLPLRLVGISGTHGTKLYPEGYIKSCIRYFWHIIKYK